MHGRDMIKIRKFHADYMKEALKHGCCDMPKGSGLYYKRLEKRGELKDVVRVDSVRRDVFRLSLTSRRFEFAFDSGKYGVFKRLNR